MAVRDITFGGVLSTIFSVLKVPKQCPLGLLVRLRRTFSIFLCITFLLKSWATQNFITIKTIWNTND
jgi:hypothetical protein